MTNFDITKLFDQEYLDTLPKITKENPARAGDILLDAYPLQGSGGVALIDAHDASHPSAWLGDHLLHREPRTWASGSILVEGDYNAAILKATRVPMGVAPLASSLRWVFKDETIGYSDAEIEKMLAENPNLRVVTPEEMN